MELFRTENGIVIPIPETLLIYPFGDIWNRDTTVGKDVATKEFAYIEFVCSMKESNPYAGYQDDIRPARVKENLFRQQPDWQPDSLIIDGIAIYKDFQDNASYSMRFYKAALIGVEKLQSYYDTLDMGERTSQGGLVNKASEVARGLSQTAGILQNLETLKKKVQQELFESGKVRGNRTVNPLER